jgi:hypothetical protein
MSARSSPRSALALALALAACGKTSATGGADPAAVQKLASALIVNMPAIGALRDCTPADLANVPALTWRRLQQLAHDKIADDPEHAAWINPPELDAPAAVTLTDDKATDAAKRSAAATLLAAPGLVIYKVDLVAAPMALGLKELKIGTVGTRVFRYDTKTTKATCVQVFNFQNTQELSDRAIEASDKAQLDPKIVQALKDDLAAQYVKLAPRAK